MVCISKWNLTHLNELTLKLNVTQNRMSLKMDCHSKWNVTQSGMSPSKTVTDCLKKHIYSEENIVSKKIILKLLKIS